MTAQDWFPDMRVIMIGLDPTEQTYISWVEQLRTRNWQEVKMRYADIVQFNLLCGLTISGIECARWPTLIADFVSGKEEWSFVNRSWIEQQKLPDLHWFVRTIVKTIVTDSAYYVPLSRGDIELLDKHPTLISFMYTSACNIYKPVFYPEWLLDYGYTQTQYIQDLKRYWSDLLPEYYHPWPGTIIGVDTASIVTIEKLGAQARQEIEALFDVAHEHVELSKETTHAAKT